MRCFLTLLRRELREARNVMIALAVIAPLALVAYEELGSCYADPLQTAQWVIPVIATLVVATLAADVVAADVATRRIDALAALPVPLGNIWRAKVTYLLLASLTAAGLLMASGLALYELRAPSELRPFLLDAIVEWWFCSLAAIPVAFSVLAFSTAVPRGFVAGLGGALCVGGAAAITLIFDYSLYELHRERELIRVGLPTVVSLLLLTGSYWAFTRGPVHGGVIRRALYAAVLPLLVAGGGASLAFATVKSGLEFAPGDPDITLSSLTVSPDGERIALVARKQGTGRSRVWLVDAGTGEVIDIPGIRTRLAESPWEADGTLQLRESRTVRVDETAYDRVHTARWVTPLTGEVVKTHSVEQFTIAQALAEVEARRAKFTRPWWHRLRTRRTGGAAWESFLDWEGNEHVLPRGTHYLTTPGWVVTPDDTGALVWHDLGSGEVRARVELGSEPGVWRRFGPDKAFLVVDGPQARRRVRLFARESGRPMGPARTWPERTNTTVLAGSAGLDGWLVLLGERQGVWRPATGTHIGLDDVSPERMASFTRGSPATLLPNGLLAIAINGGIRVYDTTNGTLLRTYIRDVD